MVVLVKPDRRGNTQHPWTVVAATLSFLRGGQETKSSPFLVQKIFFRHERVIIIIIIIVLTPLRFCTSGLAIDLAGVCHYLLLCIITLFDAKEHGNFGHVIFLL